MKSSKPLIMTLPVLGLLCMPLARAADAPVRGKPALESRVAKLERLLQSQGLVDLLDQVDALQTELQRLRGDIEFQTHTLEQIKKRQRQLYLDLDRRIQRLETAPAAQASAREPALAPAAPPGPVDNPPLQVMEPVQALPPAATPSTNTLRREPPAATKAQPAQPVSAQAPAASAAEAAGTPAETVDPAASEAAYRKAFTLLKDAHYDQAIAAFQAYLRQYPGSRYADNAQYWLGEAHYVLRQFEAAIAEYQKLIRDYPQSRKRSHALLKIGYSYQELGRIPLARETLEKLRQEYPGTTAARLAGERLQRLAAKPGA